MENLDGLGQLAEEVMLAQYAPYKTKEEVLLAQSARRVRREQRRWLWLFFVRAAAYGDGPGGLKIILFPAIFIAVTYGQWVAGLEMVGGIDGYWTTTAHWYAPFMIIPFILGAAIPMAAGAFLLIGLLVCPASYFYPIALASQKLSRRIWSKYLFRSCFSSIRQLYWELRDYSDIDFWSRTVGWRMLTEDGWTVEVPVRRYSYIQDFVLPGMTEERLRAVLKRIKVKLQLEKPRLPQGRE